jgi:hypothetical protein
VTGPNAEPAPRCEWCLAVLRYEEHSRLCPSFVESAPPRATTPEPRNFDHLRELAGEAREALLRVEAPSSPEQDRDGLYYPLLFLTGQVEATLRFVLRGAYESVREENEGAARFLADARAPLAAHPATTPEPISSGPTFNEATEAQDRMDRDAEVAAMREAWSARHPDTLDRMTIRGDGEYIMALQRIIGRLCSTIEGICEFGPLPTDLHARAPDQAERAERAIAFLRASFAPSRDSGALLDRYRDAVVSGVFEPIDGATERDGIRVKLDRHIASLERDAARMRAIDDDLDDLRWIRPSFHADGPLVELDWFVGDGGGSTLTTGATISEAVDAYLAALTPSRETSE